VTMLPAMKEDEIEMLTRHLQPGIRYLEFGSGGSTLLALDRGVGRCHCVDSDLNWIDKLRANPLLKDAETSGRLLFHHIDIGPLLRWGMPADKSRIEAWPAYFLRVWAELDADPDLVLIDGRFRTACALVTLTLCSSRTVILMHDFFDPLPLRQSYRTILDVADVIEQVGNLVSLRRKTDIPPRILIGRLAAVWTDFA
jgi:hypothetical protein